MNYYQERIETDSAIPGKIYIGKPKGGNCRYPLHWHNHLEFDLVLKGTIKGKIDGKPVTVSEGGFFFVNSGVLHETDADDKKRMCAITILLSYGLLKEYCPDIDNYYFDFTGNPEAIEKVTELILECARSYKDKETFFELEISILLRKICCVLLKDCRKKKTDVHLGTYERKNLFNIKKAIAYMEEHYADELTLKTVAAEIGMAPTYFSRFIKKNTDETFYGYLTRIRLCHAYQELLNSTASITEIAMNHGFSNVKSFIAAFKNVYELTPEKYRKLYGS